METSRFLAFVTLCALMPTAAAVPVPLPHACGGWLVGCADVLSPLVEPTKAFPMLAPPEPAPMEAEPPATAEAPAADADGFASSSWSLRERALLAAGLLLAAASLLLLALLRRARARGARRSAGTTVRDVARARRMQEDVDAAWRAARAERKGRDA